jgi:uncharacterized protein with von Willebrand factor type A (vWA) domain
VDLLLTNFIHALRNADVRISTAETLDALRTTELVGYANRQLLKDALALTLPKTLDEKNAFDACFDQFFSFRSRASPPPAEGSTPEVDESQQGDASGEGQGGGGEGSQDSRPSVASSSVRPEPVEGLRSGQDSLDPSTDSGLRANGEEGERPTAAVHELSTAAPSSLLGRMLVRANELEINIAIGAAGRAVNVQNIEVFTQKGVYTRRIMDAMGARELQQEIDRLTQSAAAGERRLGQDLTRRKDWLRERVRDYVEHQFLLHADVTGRRLREDLLRTIRLSALEHRHHRLLQELVQRMARRLVAAYSHRRKAFRRGQLHVPRTLRRNMRYDDAIFDLHWKRVKIDRPRVYAICDVSGSVADYARFMLMFLYSLDEVLPEVRSFAFSSDLGEVSELFARNAIDDAIALTLRQYGGGSTDYGQALADFRRRCLEDLDRRATVIVLGDARNNFGDARTDVLKEIYDRARRVIWLNPEPRAMWNTGDSEMRCYAPYCHNVEECGTLAQLERFVSRLLRSIC